MCAAASARRPVSAVVVTIVSLLRCLALLMQAPWQGGQGAERSGRASASRRTRASIRAPALWVHAQSHADLAAAVLLSAPRLSTPRHMMPHTSSLSTMTVCTAVQRCFTLVPEPIVLGMLHYGSYAQSAAMYIYALLCEVNIGPLAHAGLRGVHGMG